VAAPRIATKLAVLMMEPPPARYCGMCGSLVFDCYAVVSPSLDDTLIAGIPYLQPRKTPLSSSH